MNLSDCSAVALGRLIRAGELSAAEAARWALDRIARHQKENNAFLTVTQELAMEQALAFDAAKDKPSHPLAGVPAAVKDNICTKGIRTCAASRILGDFVPPYDAHVMERFRESGGVLLGKLNMDEFAMGSTSETSCAGPVRNPWNLEHVPGGSSGGAAAAVAAGECFYALGSDTGGSIRQPAAWCGVTGIKPTYGAVSRYGLIAYASSLDQIGPIARTAEDCAAVLDLIVGRDARDATSVNAEGNFLRNLTDDIRGLRIGVPAECFGDGLDDTVRERVLAVAGVLRDRGAAVEACALPELKYGVPAYYILACAEASANLARYDGVRYGRRPEGVRSLDELYCASRSEGFGPEAQRRILLGTFVLSAGFYDDYYQRALRARTVIRKAYARLFRRYDLLLTPVAPTTAPGLGESLSDPLKMYLGDLYTVPVNLAGLPAVSVPCGFDNGGLPIGAQLVGPKHGEQTLLNAAHAYQRDTDFHTRRPKEAAL